jgi:hypothetical protein
MFPSLSSVNDKVIKKKLEKYGNLGLMGYARIKRPDKLLKLFVLLKQGCYGKIERW